MVFTWSSKDNLYCLRVKLKCQCLQHVNIKSTRVSGYRYRCPGFDPWRYQIFWVVVGLEPVHSASWASWGQLRSYLNEKSSGSRSRKQRLTVVGSRCADHVTPLYPQKLALTSPTGGGRSVGIVRVRTKATEFVCFVSVTLCNYIYIYIYPTDYWTQRGCLTWKSWVLFTLCLSTGVQMKKFAEKTNTW